MIACFEKLQNYPVEPHVENAGVQVSNTSIPARINERSGSVPYSQLACVWQHLRTFVSLFPMSAFAPCQITRAAIGPPPNLYITGLSSGVLRRFCTTRLAYCTCGLFTLKAHQLHDRKWTRCNTERTNRCRQEGPPLDDRAVEENAASCRCGIERFGVCVKRD